MPASHWLLYFQKWNLCLGPWQPRQLRTAGDPMIFQLLLPAVNEESRELSQMPWDLGRDEKTLGNPPRKKKQRKDNMI